MLIDLLRDHGSTGSRSTTAAAVNAAEGATRAAAAVAAAATTTAAAATKAPATPARIQATGVAAGVAVAAAQSSAAYVAFLLPSCVFIPILSFLLSFLYLPPSLSLVTSPLSPFSPIVALSFLFSSPLSIL